MGRSQEPDTVHQSKYLLIIIMYTIVLFDTDEHMISNLRLLLSAIVHNLLLFFS